MWKVALGFIAFSGLALFLLGTGAEIDLGGEKRGAEALHAPEPVAAASTAPTR